MSSTKALIRYRATVLLAISLLLLGGVAAFGAVRLRQVISLHMRADTAAAICSTLQRQQYETLANMIDPAPVPPLATDAFNPRTFEAQLHALDQHQGAVTSCAARPLQLDDESATYTFTLSRTHAAAPIGMLVILRHEPDNGWRISRRSSFTSTPV
jgi:hypothetical protein